MTPNQRLRRLMDERSLKRQEVADQLHTSLGVVDSWLADPSATWFRQMPEAKIELLELKLAAQAAGGE